MSDDMKTEPKPLDAVVAVLRVSEIQTREYQPGYSSKHIHFSTQYDKSVLDRSFQTATPNGKAEFQIDNPAALAFFKAGKQYYVTFTEVPETPKS